MQPVSGGHQPKRSGRDTAGVGREGPGGRRAGLGRLPSHGRPDTLRSPLLSPTRLACFVTPTRGGRSLVKGTHQPAAHIPPALLLCGALSPLTALTVRSCLRDTSAGQQVCIHEEKGQASPPNRCLQAAPQCDVAFIGVTAGKGGIFKVAVPAQDRSLG